MAKKFIAAVIQDAPVLFDLQSSLTKTEELLQKAAAKGARLTLFPEAFLPAYPRGLNFGTMVGSRTDDGRKLWRLYADNSMEVPGKEVEVLGEMARKYKNYLVIGVIERDSLSQGTLYCTTLYFSPKGELLGKHRKLKPTATERVIWGEGDGSTLEAYKTDMGVIGGLICWENYMPLARMAMYEQGVQVYLAPTADQRDSWQSTMKHIAMEGRCYVLGANQYVTKDQYPNVTNALEEPTGLPDVLSRGGSVIINPLGEVVAGPLYDEPGILTAEIDLDRVTESKLDFDVIGHYARNDVFEFSVRKTN